MGSVGRGWTVLGNSFVIFPNLPVGGAVLRLCVAFACGEKIS